MRPPSITLLLTVTLQLSRALAWGAAGHEIIATIAQIHLHPTVFPALCSVLNFTSHNPNEPQCHLAPIAAWADRVRFKMSWSGRLHYVGAVGDHPSQNCAFPGDHGWQGSEGRNVLGAIRNTTNILEDWTIRTNAISASSNDAANEALKFLVHFMGDLHMPLHLTGRDRGGNSDKVRFGGRITNLHSLWDSLLIAKAIREVPHNYSRPLPSHQIESSLRGAIYDPYVRRIMWEGILNKWADEIPAWVSCPSAATSDTLWQKVTSIFGHLPRGGGTAGDTDDDVLCPYQWAKPIHALNCDIVWPKELDEPPYKHYSRFYASTDSEHHGYGEDNYDLIHEEYAPPKPVYLELEKPEYSGVLKERMVVEKLLAQAGIRLAAVINWLFADLGEGTGGLTVLEI